MCGHSNMSHRENSMCYEPDFYLLNPFFFQSWINIKNEVDVIM